MSKILSRSAEGAVKSDAAMEKYLDRLNRELPQVDRVCVSKIDDGKVRFVAVAQPAVLDYPLGRGDRTFAAADAALARYIEGRQPVTNNALPEAGADMAAMRRALGSSVHLPITIDGVPAVVSYWSKEKDAFTPAAVEFCRTKLSTKRLGQPVKGRLPPGRFSTGWEAHNSIA